MDQLLKNKEFKAKMSALSPGVKQWFINALVDLFEQESEFVIDVLEDCRYELGQTVDSYKDDTEKLRAASRMLEERRDGSDRSISRASEGAASRLSMIDEGSSGQRRRRERSRRRMCISDDDGRSASSLSVPSYPVAARTPSPASARTTRSLPVSPFPPSARATRGSPASPTPPRARGSRDLPTSPQPSPSVKTIEEETKAILQTMTDADAHVEKERERQQERLERLRRQKKFLAQDRTAQAMKLLEKALEMDRLLVQDKERQGKMLQDKLQDLKKRRSNNQSATPAPSSHMADDIPVIEDLETY